MSIPLMPRFMQSLRILEMAAHPLAQSIASSLNDLPALHMTALRICPTCQIPLDDFWCPSCESEPEGSMLTALDIPATAQPLPDVLWTMDDGERKIELLHYMRLEVDDDGDDEAINQAQQLIENIATRNEMLQQTAATILSHTIVPGQTRTEKISLETVSALSSFHEATVSRAAAGKYAWILPQRRLVSLSDLLLNSA